ncbi:DNA cytosine methyltransferase, partial [Streptomyces caeruleatus]
MYQQLYEEKHQQPAPPINLLCGGFPCQPYSTAGKRLGKEDERHLWPWMLECIAAFAPVWVVGENVSGILTWNQGQVFEEVCADLESLGYDVL